MYLKLKSLSELTQFPHLKLFEDFRSTEKHRIDNACHSERSPYDGTDLFDSLLIVLFLVV